MKSFISAFGDVNDLVALSRHWAGTARAPHGQQSRVGRGSRGPSYSPSQGQDIWEAPGAGPVPDTSLGMSQGQAEDETKAEVLAPHAFSLPQSSIERAVVLQVHTPLRRKTGMESRM